MSVALAENKECRSFDGLKAAVRYRVRSKMEMDVLDIAEGGCLLDARGWSVRPEERVLVRFAGLGEIGANVVWIEDGKCGLALEEPLNDIVLGHILS